MRSKFLGILTVCFVTWTAAVRAQSDCAIILDAIAAGSYRMTNQFGGIRPWYYEANHGQQGQSRNYFIFQVPQFSNTLVAAELRLYAGVIHPFDAEAVFELHHVQADPSSVQNPTFSNVKPIFDDLGDGAVFASQNIIGAYGTRNSAFERGTLLRIPLNVAGLNEVTARQGARVALGGALLPTPTPTSIFNISGFPPIQPELVLYFSNAAPPRITVVEPTRVGLVLAGERTHFAVTTCGQPPLVRQWQKNGSEIPGATSDVLEIRNMSAADAGEYQLIATNDEGTATTSVLELTYEPLVIESLYTSGQFHFVDGDYPPTIYPRVRSALPANYQWRLNGIPVADRTQLTLFGGRSSITRNDAGNWDVVVSNAGGSRTSSVVILTVALRAPGFIGPTTPSLVVPVGAPFGLERYSYGSQPISYQWYRNNEPIPGANSLLFQVGSAGFNDAGDYYLVAANDAGVATSSVSSVTVEALVLGALAGFEWPVSNPLTLNAQVQSTAPFTIQWYYEGEPIPGATKEQLKFAAFTNTGDYYFVASNVYGVRTSTVATITAVVTGPQAQLQTSRRKLWVGESAVLQGYASGGPPPVLQFFRDGVPVSAPVQGITATLRIDNVTTSDTGMYVLVASNVVGSVWSEPVGLTVVAEAPFFINAPLNTRELAGDVVVLRAKAVGGPGPTYQWRKNGIDLPGQTNTSLNLGFVQLSDAGSYEIVARNALGEARRAHLLQILPRTGLDIWRWRLPVPQGSRLYDIDYGDGRFVASGKAGNIISSTDGLSWMNATVPTDSDLRTVAAGNGKLIAAGTLRSPSLQLTAPSLEGDTSRYLWEFLGFVLSSSNGATWSVAQFFDHGNLESIVFGNGIFVARAYWSPRLCMVSTDGQNWTATGPEGRAASTVFFGNGRFMVTSTANHVFTSVNGIDWTQVAGEGEETYVIGFADGKFIAQSNDGFFMESTDGSSWEFLGGSQPVFPWQGFAGDNGIFVGVGGSLPSGQVLRSTDKLSWIPVDTGTRQDIEAVIHANGQFIAVGEAGTITRSTDGLNWTPDEVGNKIDFYGITHGRGLHVIAGDAGTILTSSNGRDWTRPTTPVTRNLHAVAHGDGLFVAGGRGGSLMTSPDGINWVARDSGTTNYIERIARANGLWVAVTEGGDITVSSNGVDWAKSSTGAPFTDHEGVAYGNGLWVVAGGYFKPEAVGTVYTSSDGTAWTSRAANFGKRWRDATFGKGKFVLVGNDGAVGWSTNEFYWARTDVSGQNLRRVHYASGRFVAVGNDGTLFSTLDPATQGWTRHRTQNSQNLHDIAAMPDGTFIFVGNNGMVLQSGETRPRFLRIDRPGRLEFDRGIAGALRLERSTDLRNWEIEAENVVSPFSAPTGAQPKFWRLTGD